MRYVERLIHLGNGSTTQEIFGNRSWSQCPFLPAHPAAACPWVGGGRWSSDGSGSRATGFRVQGAALNGTVVRDDFFYLFTRLLQDIICCAVHPVVAVSQSLISQKKKVRSFFMSLVFSLLSAESRRGGRPFCLGCIVGEERLNDGLLRLELVFTVQGRLSCDAGDHSSRRTFVAERSEIGTVVAYLPSCKQNLGSVFFWEMNGPNMLSSVGRFLPGEN